MTTLVAVAIDPVGLRNLRRIADDLDLTLVEFASPLQVATGNVTPLAIAIQLELPNALEVVAALKTRWPESADRGLSYPSGRRPVAPRGGCRMRRRNHTRGLEEGDG